MAKQEKTADPAVQEPAPVASIRCKFQCTDVQDSTSGDSYQKQVYMTAVTGDNLDGTPNENTSFSKTTPSAVMSLLVEQESLDEFFLSGKRFYIDIIEVDTTPDPVV
ncbi:hypothetical protein [Spirosoma lituiforme]